jgi:hypothetical protein
MHRSLGLVASLLASTSAYAQGSATPTEGMSSATRPATVSPNTTTGSAPSTPAGIGHLPKGNPEKPPTSIETHEPPSK